MQNSEINPGSFWVYLGPGDGKQFIHTVTSVSTDEITTWSQPSPIPHPTVGGWSWIGTVNDFRRCFRKCS